MPEEFCPYHISSLTIGRTKDLDITAKTGLNPLPHSSRRLLTLLQTEQTQIRQLCLLMEIWHIWSNTSGPDKVRKRAKIGNQYNQVPHLTQDTNGKVTNSQLDITNESQEVSPYPAGDHKASINRFARKHYKHKTEITWMIHRRSTALERSVKIFTWGHKPVSRCQPHPSFRCWSRHIDVWFAWKTNNFINASSPRTY